MLLLLLKYSIFVKLSYIVMHLYEQLSATTIFYYFMSFKFFVNSKAELDFLPVIVSHVTTTMKT